MANLFYFMAVSIPIIAILGWVAAEWMSLKKKQIEFASSEAAEKAAQYAAKTERLEQRVAVLERILTDRSNDLAVEINGLRDRPLN
jgi:phage shock protein B